jgi:hypothetical protein
MSLHKIVSGRYAFPRLLLATLLLTTPSLWVGLQFDDYLLQIRLLNARNGVVDPLTAINQLYVFMDGVPAHTLAQMDTGTMPWFALPTAKVAFWRPLSALTHWLDFQLWPGSYALMHLHSLLWFLALAIAVYYFYRQVMAHTTGNDLAPQWSPAHIATLAAGLYCLDDARGFAVGWLSNRNALIAALFGILTLIAHHHWRSKQKRTGLFMACAAFALALLSGESALAVMAYLIAYSVFLEISPGPKRFLTLLPYLILLTLWWLAYKALGFGGFGTSYIEPLQEPARFIQALLTRAPILFLGQWLYPPAEVYSLLTPPASFIVWGVACLVIIVIAVYLWPLLRRSSSLTRFFALGMGLSLIPAAAALPANRLLFFTGLGAMGLLALQFSASQSRSKLTRLFVGLHAIIGPLLLPLTAFSPMLIGNIEPSINNLPASSGFADQSAIFANAPSHFFIAYLPDIRALSHQPIPARLRVLAPSLVSTTYTRPDSQTLIVHPADGYLTGFDTVYRDPTYSFQVNQYVQLSDMQVTILELTSDGRPATVAFQFNQPLEDPSLIWFKWNGTGYQPFTPPPVGHSLTLQPVSPVASLFSTP